MKKDTFICSLKKYFLHNDVLQMYGVIGTAGEWVLP